jgi:hypothetical protein
MTDKEFYATINKVYSTTYGVSMLNELSIANKLQRITRSAKLGELPQLIEQRCAEEAKKGLNKCRIYFSHPKPGAAVPFHSLMGPANQTLWKEINKPFDRTIFMLDEDFYQQVIDDLVEETELVITILPIPRPEGPGAQAIWLNKGNLEDYRYSSLVVDISW